MSDKLLGCMFVAVFALVGCSKRPEVLIEGDKKDPSPERPNAKQFADVLPRETIAYVSLRAVGTFKDRLILPEYLKNADGLRKRLDGVYASLLENTGDINPFGLSTSSCKKYIFALKSVHLAVLLPAGAEEELVWFVEMANGEIAQEFIKELGDKQAGPTFSVLEDSVLVSGSKAALQSIFKTKADGKAASLGQSRAFQTAERDWGTEGEVFFFASFDGLRALNLLGTPATPQPGVSKESKNKPFAEFGSVAGSVGTDGSLNVRIYAEEGKKFPDFMVRRSASKRFLTRVPADALLIAAWSYDGSKNTRKSFSDWLKEEIKKVGTDGVFSDPVLGLIAHNLDQLEEEVVVMVNDLWVAILPVKTEMEIFVAPNEKGQWGAALFFDIEDKRQIEELKDHIFEAGNRRKLPWKVMTHQGVTIHYLDLEELARKQGKELVPPALAGSIQTKIGYAQSDTLFLAGSVEAIQFALDPKGPTFADAVRYDRIDRDNAALLTLQPGRLVHSSMKFGPLEGLKKMLADRIPKDSSLSVTLTFEETQTTLKSNIPFATIATWIALEQDEFRKATR